MTRSVNGKGLGLCDSTSTYNHIDLFEVLWELRVKRHGEGEGCGFGKICPDPRDCLWTRMRLDILVLVQAGTKAI